jgi:hypothetical protein
MLHDGHAMIGGMPPSPNALASELAPDACGWLPPPPFSPPGMAITW